MLRCNMSRFAYFEEMMTKILFRVFGWCFLAAILFMTVSPIGLRPHTIVTPDVDRAAAFFLSGAIFAIAYPRRWISLALFIIAAAFAIEALQFLSPSRHARFNDAEFKAAGAVAGIVAGKIALSLRRALLRRYPVLSGANDSRDVRHRDQARTA